MSSITFGIFGLKRHLAEVTFKFKEQAREKVDLNKARTLLVAFGSPVLAPCSKMILEIEIEKNFRKNVEIKDIQPNVFEHLIRHVYNIDDVAKLLAASDKYGMDSLKEECCSLRLSRTLNVGNAVQNLVLAHLLKAPRCYTI
jgi:speckle-type POZ protein